jgi:hypothetical protein
MKDSILKDIKAGVKLPVMSPLLVRDWWVIVEEYKIGNVVIPSGFHTNLDSIPPLPFIYTLLKGRARISSLVHDFLYATGEAIGVSRKDADEIFKELILVETKSKIIAALMHTGVRLFGESRYNRFKKATTVTDSVRLKYRDFMNDVHLQE